MTAPRTDPEVELLLDHLAAQRRHVLGILEGLDDEAMRRPVLPSGWSPVGLVQHLALDDERFWFQAVVGGDPDAIASVTGAPDDAWQVSDDVPVAAVLERYRAEAARTDEIVRGTSLETAPAWWPDFFGGFRLHTVREVLLHVLTETATHAGHLDAARELIDGRTWLVLG